MSGADELDEAVALANGAAHGARRGDGREAPEGGETPRPRSGDAASGTGRGAGNRTDRESGSQTRDVPGSADGSGAGSGTDGGPRGGSPAPSPDDGDELAAPDWVTPRSARGGGHRSGRTAGEAPSHARDAPWPDARTHAARAAGPLPSLALPLDQALDHTLGAPLDALTDLPSFDTSAMDGWAVSGPGPWSLADDATGTGILAGDTSEPRPLPDGRAIPIATGARIPPGASAVLRSEYGESEGGRLRTTRRPQPGTDIRPRGQECRSGDRLLPAGTRVTPAVLGLAAAAGYDRLTVTRRPRAEVLVLGDELLHRGVPHGGRIRDALGPAVAPWLSALGAEVIVTRRLGDDAEALHEAVATTTADLLVTTGGTARGPVDHLRPTLARVGARLLVEGVRVRPGHPMLLARLPERQEPGTGGGPLLVGLPGNPLAAVSGLVTLAAPLIRALGDRPAEREVFARITEDVQGHPRDTRLVPVAFAPAASRARPLHFNGPAMLRGVATATALAVVPPGGASSGSDVQVLPLPWFAW
ncbi:molybdopterin molybdotransferase MoeA [Streptomyces sp. WMMB 322]|uniref:molybdopterin molybdotransferase MoeA n=1 Tax=Streptomyces sp. WMMB 322 TaxID=1286821 RepID=UPI0006E2E89A|nr:molybdopterin molybdotransferase MoeA [Streptomyces sp. WMMB 322]SCK16271.1 molybdopterin molybdotransferase [Streptomyces sp. WMMB 322]